LHVSTAELAAHLLELKRLEAEKADEAEKQRLRAEQAEREGNIIQFHQIVNDSHDLPCLSICPYSRSSTGT
jgi:hypothetical protein